MHLYRYESNQDGYGNVKLYVYSFIVLKETPHYYWIQGSYANYKNGLRRIAKVGKNIYARPTKEAALLDCKHRTARRIKILTAQLDFAKEVAIKIDATIQSKENTQAIGYLKRNLMNNPTPLEFLADYIISWLVFSLLILVVKMLNAKKKSKSIDSLLPSLFFSSVLYGLIWPVYIPIDTIRYFVLKKKTANNLDLLMLDKSIIEAKIGVLNERSQEIGDLVSDQSTGATLKQLDELGAIKNELNSLSVRLHNIKTKINELDNN